MKMGGDLVFIWFRESRSIRRRNVVALWKETRTFLRLPALN